MLIDCPACAASYHVSRSEIGGSGRTVICPRCDTQWFVGGEATDLAPSPHDLRASAFSSHPTRSVSSQADHLAQDRASLWRTMLPAVSVAVVLVLAMASIGLRDRIVRASPRTAVLYTALGLPVNVRGLEIAQVVSTRMATTSGASGRNDLIVTGEIRNVVRHRASIPRLSYEVHDASGATLMIWTEHAPARSLAVGRTLPFVSSPHTIPPEVRSIIVRFAPPDGSSDALQVAGRAD